MDGLLRRATLWLMPGTWSDVDTATGALELSETITLAIEEGKDTIFDDDGNVSVHIIRPGVGKGRGRHYYSPEMLAENAQKFTGWRMYVDHLSPEARKAAGGLPRKVRDIGGRIVEAKWDPTVPADPDKGYEQGAVVGKARPVPYISELIEHDPEIIEASISASATAVKPGSKGGQRVWLVEGINDRGSVDWVTEAGAGGRVVPLLEAHYSNEEEVEMALLESLSDDEFKEYVKEHRPELYEAHIEEAGIECPSCKEPMKGEAKECASCGHKIAEAAGSDDGEGGDDELAAEVKRLVAKGIKPAQAEAMAKNSLKKKDMEESGNHEEDEMPITPEALQEALSENPGVLLEALQKDEKIQEFLNGLVEAATEAKMDEERPLMRAEEQARHQRETQLRDMRDEAHRLIGESRLPETWQEGLCERYKLVEGKPTDDLDQVDVVDDEGEVTKPAIEALRESVEESIKAEQRRLAEVAPTRVRGQGARAEAGKDGEEAPPKSEGTFYAQILSEAGIDPEAAWAAK